MRSLDPVSLSEKLLWKSGDRKDEPSDGSDLRVIDTLPGTLRPLSNLCSDKVNKYDINENHSSPKE